MNPDTGKMHPLVEKAADDVKRGRVYSDSDLKRAKRQADKRARNPQDGKRYKKPLRLARDPQGLPAHFIPFDVGQRVTIRGHKLKVAHITSQALFLKLARRDDQSAFRFFAERKDPVSFELALTDFNGDTQRHIFEAALQPHRNSVRVQWVSRAPDNNTDPIPDEEIQE